MSVQTFVELVFVLIAAYPATTRAFLVADDHTDVIDVCLFIFGAELTELLDLLLELSSYLGR